MEMNGPPLRDFIGCDAALVGRQHFRSDVAGFISACPSLIGIGLRITGWRARGFTGACCDTKRTTARAKAKYVSLLVEFACAVAGGVAG